jgi:predicted nicotinamide N-methyase
MLVTSPLLASKSRNRDTKNTYQVVMQDIDLTDINAVNPLFFIILANDYVYTKPVKRNLGGLEDRIESLGTIITVLSLLIYFCFKK